MALGDVSAGAGGVVVEVPLDRAEFPDAPMFCAYLEFDVLAKYDVAFVIMPFVDGPVGPAGFEDLDEVIRHLGTT